MIKVEELKRDNYLFQKSRGINLQIDNPRGLHQITAWGIDWPIEDFEPIPLTPEWLERCGFVRDRGGWHLPGTQFSLTDQFYPCWLDRMLWPQDIPDFKSLSLQYLHQLQNLYYALTGEELIITL